MFSILTEGTCMPFYEYRAKKETKSCEHCIDLLELMQSIKDNPATQCPYCGSEIEKLISMPGAFITLGKEMNCYNDVKYAKYWRDKNGVRHKVTAADGSSNSPTVSRRVTNSPETIEKLKKADKEKTSKRLKKIKHPPIRRIG